MARPPSSLLETLVGWCFMLLGALALYGAVQLICQIWPVLVIALAVIGVVAIVGWMGVRWWGYR